MSRGETKQINHKERNAPSFILPRNFAGEERGGGAYPNGVCPPCSHRLRSQFVTVDNAGHLPHVEAPDICVGIMVKFLRSSGE
jgi:hypothetical protein